MRRVPLWNAHTTVGRLWEAALGRCARDVGAAADVCASGCARPQSDERRVKGGEQAVDGDEGRKTASDDGVSVSLK